MEKIRVLHITQALGGVKTYIREIFKHIDKARFEVTLVAPPSPDFQRLCKEYGITYIETNIKRQINPFADVYSFVKLLRIIKRYKPHLMHVHSAKGGTLGKLTSYFHKVPVIFTPNAFSYLPFYGIKRVLFYTIEYLFRNRVDRLLAVSHSEYDRAVTELNYRKDRISVVPNSVTINNNNNRDRTFESCATIGMIGRLTRQKDPTQFLQLARTIKQEYPGIRFKLLGKGYHDDQEEEVSAFIKNNQLDNVEILAWGDYNIDDFYDKLDIFVLTSNFEGLPLSLLEAMRSGLPCVVTKVDGNKDVIENGKNGFIGSSLCEMHRQLISLIMSSDLRKKIGSTAAEYIRSFHNSSINVKSIEDIYTSVLENKFRG